MTAMVTGVKSMEGYLSVDHTAKRGELDEKKLEAARLKTILEQAKANNMSVGMASTARITHTTPAACYAHTTIVTGADSDKAAGATVPDIAAQLVDFSLTGGIDVAFRRSRAHYAFDSQRPRIWYRGKT